MKTEPTTTKRMHNRSYSRTWKEDSITNADAIKFLESIPKEKIVGMSKVNKAFTKEQVWNIFMNAAKGSKPDEAIYPSEFKNLKREFGTV